MTATATTTPKKQGSNNGQPLDAVHFFETIFAPGDHVLIRPLETWLDNGQKKNRVDFEGIVYLLLGMRDTAGNWQPDPRRLELGLHRIFERAAIQKTNVIFGVCPRLGSHAQFDKAWQIRTVRTLWLDIDDCQYEEALQRCKDAGIPAPSIVVNSGNGCHLYWLLKEPFLIDDAGTPPPVHAEFIDDQKTGKKKRRLYILDKSKEKIYLDGPQNVPPLSPKALHVQDVLSGVAAEIGGDHTQDLSRLLRVPGTLNRKDQRNGREPKPCELISLNADARYPFSDFEKFADKSPSRQQREQIEKTKLPTIKIITPKRQDQFNDLVTQCEVAPVGTRSEIDFALCCWCIEHGIPQDTVWGAVQNVGKFAGNGKYFHKTWSKAEGHTREKFYTKAVGKANKKKTAGSKEDAELFDEKTVITNAEIIEEGETKTIIPLKISDIILDIDRHTQGALRRVGKALFTHNTGDDPIHWLESPPALFGYLQSAVGVDWKHGSDLVGREEFFCEMQRLAPGFDAVEIMPHWPPIPGVYYTCPMPEAGDGHALSELIDRHCLETEYDRELAFALYATGLWGGPPGTRPAFLITAATGRGKGKTRFSQNFARVFGGYLDISPQEDIGTIKQRFLSPSAAQKRIATLDNLKTPRFSWAEFENFITADQINGKRMYLGDASRPNLITWTITLNGASLSTDMAQRVVEICLREPTYRDTWEEEVTAFIDANREKIIADCIGFLQRPAMPMKRYTRWATWESQVLSKVDHPDNCVSLILDRRGAVDVEQEEGAIVEDYFAHKLTGLRYDADRDDVFIYNDVAARWFNEATGDHKKVTGVTRALKQLYNEHRVFQIVQSRSSDRTARGFRWIGQHADAADVTHYDLRTRIATRLQEQREPTEERGESW